MTSLIIRPEVMEDIAVIEAVTESAFLDAPHTNQLMREALTRLSEQGASGCVVLGDPLYYQRFGFKNEARLVLPDVPPEYFMAMSFGQSLPTGTVTYHQAFSMFE